MSDDDDFDPDAFRAVVDGDAGASGTSSDSSTSATENHAAAEGTEASGDIGSQSTLREMLMSTDPAPKLTEVESPWDPENGGPTRIKRAVMKATGVDGMPAIADLLIGAAETFDGMDLEDIDAGDDQEGGADLA